MKKTDEFEKIDYTKLRKEIDEVVTDRHDVIVKKAKITFDGRQYLVRIPKEISKIMKITEDDMIEFTLTIPSPKSKEEKKIEMKLVKQ